MSAPLPWQQRQWARLLAHLDRDNLPHALLLTGRRGIGKQRLAEQFAELLLCESPQQHQPCGHCKGCLLLRAETHPDFRTVTPLEGKKVISVDQVRDLSSYLSLTAQYGGYQVVIITPADAMNVNAANSLLKTLEEPPAQTLLLLISDRPASLSATIRSRCQVIDFERPAESEALAWLKKQQPELDAETCQTVLALADGAPLRAVELAESGAVSVRIEMLEALENIASGRLDPLEIANKWLKLGVKESLYWVYGWLVDMVRLKVSAQPPFIGNPDVESRLNRLAAGSELSELYRRLDRVNDALRLADNPALNGEMLIEGVLLGWTPRR